MTTSRSPKLIGTFLFFFALLNFPVIGFFNQEKIIVGIPLLYAYLFSIWLVFIILMFLIVRK